MRIGIDLGGTKIEAVVVRDGGEVVARSRVATESEGGYEHILERTRALALQVAKDAGIDPLATRIGVGMPGSVSMTTGVPVVKNSNTTALNGRPFRADLARALGTTDIAFANDANCFALAETIWGAARGARVAFGVIMGTGVGGGIVLDGKAWDGAQGIAGEWGHTTLDPVNGPPCYCGRRGCVEMYLSGPALERAQGITRGALRGLTAEQLDLFGRALSFVVNIVDPDVIVLGGGVSNLDVLYTDGIEALTRWTFNDELRTKVVKNELGDSAGVLGAALL